MLFRSEKDVLDCRTKYVRIVSKPIGNKTRYFTQLIKEGLPPTRGLPKATEGIGGLDEGPSNIAVVVPNSVAAFLPLAPMVQTQEAEIRRLQRAMDRSLRATNPAYYNVDGTIKKGRKTWEKSRQYLKLQRKVKKLKQSQASERKRSHGETTNKLVALAKDWKGEDISHLSFQKNYGKSEKFIKKL